MIAQKLVRVGKYHLLQSEVVLCRARTGCTEPATLIYQGTKRCARPFPICEEHARGARLLGILYGTKPRFDAIGGESIRNGHGESAKTEKGS